MAKLSKHIEQNPTLNTKTGKSTDYVEKMNYPEAIVQSVKLAAIAYVVVSLLPWLADYIAFGMLQQMPRHDPKTADPIEYIQTRVDQLAEERGKNDDQTAHMVLDKSIYELCEVLELLKRQRLLDHV